MAREEREKAMETMGQGIAGQGLHVRPAAPPARPSRAWRVLKWLLFTGIVGVCLVVGLGKLLFSTGLLVSADKINEERISGPSEFTAVAKVAVVTAHAVLLGDEQAGEAAWIIEQLDRAKKDGKVKAIILDVDSPGGGITACDIIHNKVMEVKKAHKKIFVLMRNVAASGGYYISAPADEIYAHPTTITGSIGVILSSFNVEGLFEKIGVKAVVFKTGDYKDILSPYRPVSEVEREMLEGVTQEMFERFKEVVAQGRGLTEEEIEAVSTGAIFTAKQAVELKLVDKIGYFDEVQAAAVKAAGGKDVAVVRYEQPPTVADMLFGRSNVGAGRIQKRLETAADVTRPGFYYLWPGP